MHGFLRACRAQRAQPSQVATPLTACRQLLVDDAREGFLLLPFLLERMEVRSELTVLRALA